MWRRRHPLPASCADQPPSASKVSDSGVAEDRSTAVESYTFNCHCAAAGVPGDATNGLKIRWPPKSAAGVPAWFAPWADDRLRNRLPDQAPARAPNDSPRRPQRRLHRAQTRRSVSESRAPALCVSWSWSGEPGGSVRSCSDCYAAHAATSVLTRPSARHGSTRRHSRPVPRGDGVASVVYSSMPRSCCG